MPPKKGWGYTGGSSLPYMVSKKAEGKYKSICRKCNQFIKDSSHRCDKSNNVCDIGNDHVDHFILEFPAATGEYGVENGREDFLPRSSDSA